MSGWFSGKGVPVGLMPGGCNTDSFYQGIWRASSFARSKKEKLRPSQENGDGKHANKPPVVAGRSFLMSLAIHTLFVGGICLLCTDAPKAVDPVVVTLLAPEPQGGGGGGSRPREEAKAPHSRVRSGKIRTAQAPRPVLKTAQEQMIQSPAVAAASSEAVAVPAQAEPQEAVPPLRRDLHPKAPSMERARGEGWARGQDRGSAAARVQAQGAEREAARAIQRVLVGGWASLLRPSERGT